MKQTHCISLLALIRAEEGVRQEINRPTKRFQPVYKEDWNSSFMDLGNLK